MRIMDEVEFKRTYKLPGLAIRKGETGVLWKIDKEGTHWVSMDRKYPELRVLSNMVPVWDNAAHKTLERERPDRYLRVIAQSSSGTSPA